MRRFLFVLSVGVAAGCDSQITEERLAPAANPAMIERGRAVYNFRCYFCHGYSGDAKTLAATFLAPPPRNFLNATPDSLPYSRVTSAVREGRPGTAMKPFQTTLSEPEIESVSAFVFHEFVNRKAPNTRYHTPENGWENHEKYAAAFPFALGEIGLEVVPETLNDETRRGREIFMSSCISCHDRGKLGSDNINWDSRPLSYPRHNFDHRNPEVDAASSATPYRLHDQMTPLNHPTPKQRAGEKLFQANCAFCHAADGTGKNWIGSFLEPHPRNLTDPGFMSTMTRSRLKQVMRDGLPGTSMPAWKDVLTERQIDAIAAYVDAAFHPLAD